ncbi:hypothetical protein BFC22_06855 [Carnobacterium divergens]|uniref:hypothetical protein n=1 Tax=Carnobacterium divergens TaxID=2748 RepID=UPI000E73528C|nr:hypothetical protein [Carnobacterium divergens]ANZ99833.1 hypothetical protein BFC22_06855 [Carnobacterium divergens]MDT2010681.1 hypothetical protein [Carnobacterium divergens]
MEKKQILGWVLLVFITAVVSIAMFDEFTKDAEKAEIGEEIIQDDFNYKVNKFEIKNDNDRKDIVVSIEAKSNNDETVSNVFSNNFILKIDDKTFKPDDIKSRSIVNGKVNYLYTNQINPEQTVTCLLVFNVSAKQSESKKIDLLINDNVVVNLK